MKILVLGGGDSPEREVSLRSAKAVADAARAAGFEVIEADPADGLDILDNFDGIVLPILHGKNGEDGVIQKELEKRNIKFLGSDSTSSKNCFDKWATRQILEQANIPMPEGFLVNQESYLQNGLSKQPHVLKIPHGGSSIGTLVVENPQTLARSKIDELFSMEDHAVLERLIEGNEITVPILGSQALPVIEIIPPDSEEFDYENKYNGKTQELCPPKNIPSEIQIKARDLAEEVHSAMGCRHLSRVDIMINKDGKPFVLEINTMPGLTDQSLFPKAAAVSGLSMSQLVHQFVELVAS